MGTGAQLSLAFVHNLLRRHPACLMLLDGQASGPAAEVTGRQDPYREAEQDPAQAQALDSSLWEVQVLRNHYCPQVGRATAL